MKVTLSLSDEDAATFWDHCGNIKAFQTSFGTFFWAGGGDVFRDLEGNFWKLIYDSYSYEYYPYNSKLYGPVEPKVKEVIIYE